MFVLNKEKKLLQQTIYFISLPLAVSCELLHYSFLLANCHLPQSFSFFFFFFVVFVLMKLFIILMNKRKDFVDLVRINGNGMPISHGTLFACHCLSLCQYLHVKRRCFLKKIGRFGAHRKKRRTCCCPVYLD